MGTDIKYLFLPEKNKLQDNTCRAILFMYKCTTRYYQIVLDKQLLFSYYVMSDSFATPQTVALQVPLSVEFSRQEYQSGLPFPPPGHLPDPGIKSTSPALPGKPFQMYKLCIKMDYNTHQTHHGYFICKGRKGPDQKVIARRAFHFTQNSLIFFTKKKNVCIFFRYLYMQKGWEIIY